VRETALNSGVIEVLVEDSDPRRAQRTVAALVGLATSTSLEAARTAPRLAHGRVRAHALEQELERFAVAQERMMHSQAEAPELLAPEGAAETMMTELSTLEVERTQLELSRAPSTRSWPRSTRATRARSRASTATSAAACSSTR
jgi:hypothetical protein